MAIFDNKRKKDLESDDKNKPSSRKKKKDNLPKPWSKKERMLVVYIFSGTILFSAVLALSSRSWKIPNFPEISLSSINPFKSRVIELGGKRTSPEHQEFAKNVISDFRKKTGQLSGIYGLFVADLLDEFHFGTNEEDVFQAASLIKLPVMIALYQEEEDGKINLDESYFLKEEDKKGGTGSLQYKDSGYEITYRQILKKMGEESDNTAFNIVTQLLGEEKIKKTIEDLGMKDTNYEKNETTPKDIGLVFKKLWGGDLISKTNKEEMLKFLTNTGFEDHLPAGLPDGTKISHKVGFEIHVINDAGIVFAETPYVIVVMSKGVVEKEANDIFPEISKDIYKVFSSE